MDTTTSNSPGLPSGGATGTLDQMRDVGEKAQGQVAEAADSAKRMVGDASENLAITFADQKRAGAQQLSNFARAVQIAAEQLSRDTPELAQYVRGAADQVQGLSDKLRQQDAKELFSEFQSFARRHPTAFFGATMLVGFALARFLKSAPEQAAAPRGATGTSRVSDVSAPTHAGAGVTSTSPTGSGHG